MANATDNRAWKGIGSCQPRPPLMYDGLVGAAVELFAGTLAGALLSDVDLPLVPMAVDGSTEIRGFVQYHINNLLGAKGDRRARVQAETGSLDNSVIAPLANSTLWGPVYAEDNHTGSATDQGISLPCIGMHVGFDSASPNGTGKPIVWADPYIAKLVQLVAQTGGKGLVRRARVVATANLPLTGAATVDGVVLATGDLCFAAGQTTASQIGLYVVNTAGAWTLASSWATGLVFPEAKIDISEGTSFAHSEWKITTQGAIVVGTTALAAYPRRFRGTGALVAGALTVPSLWLLAGGIALPSYTAFNGPGSLRVSAQVAGAGTGSATVQSSSGGDASSIAVDVLNW